MTEATGPSAAAPTDFLSRAHAVLGNRKTVTMLGLGFSAGLPYALLVGTINGWFSDAKVDLATIGVLSWITLGYAFKFLWSPAINLRPPFPFNQLGRRRGWILLCQSLMAVSIFVISLLDPTASLGFMALAAAIAAFASATQDMSIDAWRIEVADESTPIDMLSAVYQFGGAGALILADYTNWNVTFAAAAVVMALATLATFGAPEPVVEKPRAREIKAHGEADANLRFWAVAAVMLAWGWAGFELVWMMIASVTSVPPPDVKAFTATYGPAIVVATVIFPCVLAAWIAHRRQLPFSITMRLPPLALAATSRLYEAIVEPFVELMTRLRWASILVLVLILSYRLTDAIWGPFAYPFYMGELAYTKTEVAFASKTFGVIILMFGIVLAAWSLLALGRMLSLMIGAITAAATNLLYADLANGAPFIDAFLNMSGLGWFAGHLGIDQRMMRLMAAIGGENIAAGYAGAVFVAYMSSLASRLHGAVQFAVFSSLTMLVGTLGRGALGDMIKTDGYVSVFVFTTLLGGIAVVACALEWIRQHRAGH